MSLIELQDVYKIYGRGSSQVNALNGVSLKIDSGEAVIILGPSGSGKCVTGDTLVITEAGIPEEIRNIKTKQKILSFDNGKIKPVCVEQVHKRVVNNLLKVKLASGKEIITTPEHPFFTITSEGYRAVPIKKLKSKFIATPRKFNVNSQSKRLNPFNYLSLDSSIVISDSNDLFKTTIKDLQLTRKSICNELGFAVTAYDAWRNYCNIPLKKFRAILKLGNKEIEEYENNIHFLNVKTSPKKIKIPKQTSSELLEFYGYVAGDGWLDTAGVEICNYDKEIRLRIALLSKDLFDILPTECIKNRFDLNSKVLRKYFQLLFEFPTGKKSNTIKLPDFVFSLPDKEIAAFIQALFDCDGSISKDRRVIEITLASSQLIKQVATLLLRFGIHSRISEKFVKTTNKTYYRLTIPGLDNLFLYDKHIGFRIKYKSERLKSHIVGLKQNTNIDIIPIGAYLRTLRKKYGVRLNRKVHHKLWSYEAQKINPSRNKLRQLITLINNEDISRELDFFLNSDIFWDKIISIKSICKTSEVYDLTLPSTSNFIANNIIVHNSTMMQMVGCLDLPTKGKILLAEKDISKLRESQLATLRGKKIGFVFQTFNLISHLTAEENVALAMDLQDKDSTFAKKRAKELLKLVGLEKRGSHTPGKLSGGEKQRVAIARALANDPDLILADEPTGNLDSKTGQKIMEVLSGLNKKGKTLVVVTHDKSLCAFGNRIVYLRDGKIEKIEKKRR